MRANIDAVASCRIGPAAGTAAMSDAQDWREMPEPTITTSSDGSADRDVRGMKPCDLAFVGK
jgi:hypothetical protein